VVLATPNAGMRAVSPGRLLGIGRRGRVFDCLDIPSLVIKLFHPNLALSDLQSCSDRIDALLDCAQPILPGGTLLAFPVARVEDKAGGFLGYAMPKIHPARTESLCHWFKTDSAKHRGLPADLLSRVRLGAHLADLVSALHGHGLGLGPFNAHALRADRQNLQVSFQACDKFDPQPSKPLIDGDRFALAVTLFKLLNFGLNPYSGKAIHPDTPQAPEARMAERIFAYGRTLHPLLAPLATSVHYTLPEELHALFEQALGPHAAPDASEWAKLLKRYATRGSQLIILCDKNLHFRFAGQACAECALSCWAQAHQCARRVFNPERAKFRFTPPQKMKRPARFQGYQIALGTSQDLPHGQALAQHSTPGLWRAFLALILKAPRRPLKKTKAAHPA
jgi:DNA-binding helix-hairpin-helix protein with protein kinase domain